MTSRDVDPASEASPPRRPPRLPFLAGPADFTVGLAPIDPQAWLVPDWEVRHLPEKRALLERARHAVSAVLPISAAAQAEAACLVERAVGAPQSGDLLHASARVSDDLVVLQPQDGQWTVTALTLCAPTFFAAEEAIGRDVSVLHGPVPDRLANGAQGLGARISRVFSALRPDLILERHNWTVQPGPDRFAPASGPLFDRVESIDPAEAADILHLRVERQTIRRLPDSGGVLFTIRVSLDPLASVTAIPGAAQALWEAIAMSKDAVQRYKKWNRLTPLLRAALSPAK